MNSLEEQILAIAPAIEDVEVDFYKCKSRYDNGYRSKDFDLAKLVAIHRKVYEEYHHVSSKLTYTSGPNYINIKKQLSDIEKASPMAYAYILIHSYRAITTTDKDVIQKALTERYLYAAAKYIPTHKMIFAYKTNDGYKLSTIYETLKAFNIEENDLKLIVPGYYSEPPSLFRATDIYGLHLDASEAAKHATDIVYCKFARLFDDMRYPDGAPVAHSKRYRLVVMGRYTTDVESMKKELIEYVRANPEEEYYVMVNLANVKMSEQRSGHVRILNGYRMTQTDLNTLADTIKGKSVSNREERIQMVRNRLDELDDGTLELLLERLQSSASNKELELLNLQRSE